MSLWNWFTDPKKPKYELLTDGKNWAVRSNYGVYAECLASFNPMSQHAFFDQGLNIDSCWTTKEQAEVAYRRLMAGT